MGRYYFHLRAGDEIRSDEEGQDLLYLRLSAKLY